MTNVFAIYTPEQAPIEVKAEFMRTYDGSEYVDFLDNNKEVVARYFQTRGSLIIKKGHI